MIIGNGLIATAFAPAFRDQADILVFASGVSNSRETRGEEFARERALLLSALQAPRYTVYFSTCSVHDAELLDSPYVQHKLELEDLVRTHAPRSTVLRLPQVVGRTPNPHTLTNFLHRQIKANQPFHVWKHARRNLIDVDDVLAIGARLIGQHQGGHLTTNIACPFSVAVPELVAMFEQVLDRRALCDTVDAGAGYALDTSVSDAAAAQAGVSFPPHYVSDLIRKYYA